MPSFATSAIWDFVSQYDIDGEIECGPDAIPGDLNGDGLVNAADLALLLNGWGVCVGCVGDLNRDGTVGAADLAILLNAWS